MKLTSHRLLLKLGMRGFVRPFPIRLLLTKWRVFVCFRQRDCLSFGQRDRLSFGQRDLLHSVSGHSVPYSIFVYKGLYRMSHSLPNPAFL